MNNPLEVDCFEIDIETLDDATKGGLMGDLARRSLVEDIQKNLTQEGKKRFEEYQEQNDPCR